MKRDIGSEGLIKIYRSGGRGEEVLDKSGPSEESTRMSKNHMKWWESTRERDKELNE